MNSRSNDDSAGSTTIALALVVAASAALLAGAAGAQGECPTSRARSEIAAVGSAMVAWYADLTSGFASAAGVSTGGPVPVCPGSPPVDMTLIPPIHAYILSIFLVPDYIAAVPFEDPWGHPYEYRLDVAEPLSADVLSIRSAGADELYEGTAYDVRFTGGPSDDLVFYDGAWIRDLPRLDPVSRQRLTLAQVLEVGDAILEWYTDVVGCAGGTAAASSPRLARAGLEEVDMADYPPISATDLAELLSSPWLYTRCVPESDGWGTTYDYRLEPGECGGGVPPPLFAIRSLGADALAEGDVYTTGTFPADERDHDIVWAVGQMIREPDESGVDLFRDGFESGELWGYWSCGPGF